MTHFNFKQTFKLVLYLMKQTFYPYYTEANLQPIHFTNFTPKTDILPTSNIFHRARNLLLHTRYDPGIQSSVFDSGALF